MTRRQEIERIIIGTLLGDFPTYYTVCRNLVTVTMFSDDYLKELYTTMKDMDEEGIEVDVQSVIERKDIFIGQEAAKLCELATEWSFLHKKVSYNMNIELFDKTGKKPFTEVQFEDYVRRFIYLSLSEVA